MISYSLDFFPSPRESMTLTTFLSNVDVQVLLTDEGGSIPAPLFVTWFQCAFTVALFRLLATLREWFGRKGFFAQFPVSTHALRTRRAYHE